jgi:hypothetical protein
MTISTSKKIALWLILFLILEGMLVKSAFFIGNDPTLFHYIASAIIGFLIFLICIINNLIKYTIKWQFILFAMCIIWSFFSSYQTGYVPNLIAVFTFSCMFLFFFVSIPIIIYTCERDLIKSIYFPFFIMAFISIFLYITEISSTIDPMSGRFLGSYISVANASVGFSFFTAFSAALIFNNNHNTKKVFYIMMTFLGLYLCFLTKTRSIILEIIVTIAIIYYGNRISNPLKARAWFAPSIVAIGVLGSILVVAVGNLDWSDTAIEYRVSEGSLQDSRTGNWAFGIERTLNAPLFGEGMLTKQTQGGTRSLDLAGGDNYDSSYDPHSLILSFSVQAGIPFAIGMIFLIFGTLIQHIKTFGIKKSLASAEFVICSVHTFVMIPTGGDLTSFGNYGDRIYWILLGMIALRANLQRSEKSSYRHSFVGRSRPRVIVA